MIEPPAASVHMDNVGVRINRLIFKCFTRRNKDQFCVGGTTHAHQYPDCHEAIQVWRKVADDD
jgi:hypothetical protein